jgi:hypothetical protein
MRELRELRELRWATWGARGAPAATPLWVAAGAAVLMATGGNDGMASAVAGGALLCLAGFGAGSRRLEPVRVRAARGAG